MRIAILAGVSTDPQAKDDKLSIPDQIKTCRAYITANSAAETAGPYIMDGYSRTGYDSLEIAMREIPPLAQAVKDAAKNKYDILLMDNFDRLGDIGFILQVRFKKLRKQLHSVRQSGALIPPAQYDPYSNESTEIQMHVEGIIQTYRINKIRRGWNIGVPNRARSGLHPLSLPYAYKLAAKNQPAILIPEKAQLLTQIKDLYLQGKPLGQIAQHANDSGIKPPRSTAWSRIAVKRIILNPYYAGLTIYGRYKHRVKQPRSQWIISKGHHQPIWDETTYNAILAEQERRDSLRIRSSTYTLSGLLVCEQCGHRLHRHGRLNDRFDIRLTCRNTVPACTSIKYDHALQLVAEKITEELKGRNASQDTSAAVEELSQKINTAQQRRVKIQQGFESSLYTTDEASKHMTEIEKDIEKLNNQIARLNQRQQQQQTLIALASQSLTQFQDWILHDNPATVNRLLTTLIERITIHPQTHRLTIHFR